VPDAKSIQTMMGQMLVPKDMGIRLAVVTDQQAVTPNSLAIDGILMGTVKIHPLLLTKPSEARLDPSHPSVGIGLPQELARFSLEIQGVAYDLAFLSEAHDEKYQLRHVTMAVLNQPDSYARFTVDDVKAQVYGTIQSPTGVYRLVQTPGSQDQWVFRLSPKTTPAAALTPHSADTPVAGTLARRHQEVEVVAELQPAPGYPIVLSDEDRFTQIRGGNLGTMRSRTPAAFVTAMRRLAAISRVTGKEIFRVRRVDEAADGVQVRYEQMIGGIPVDGDSVVTLDSAGKITGIEIRVIPWNANTVQPKLSEKAALQKSIACWADTYRATANNVEVIEPGKLYYASRDPQRGLTLIYEFKFRINSGFIYRALVNAETGDTEIVNTAQAATGFGHTTCQDVSSTLTLPSRRPQPPPTGCSNILYSVSPKIPPAIVGGGVGRG
jgi:hypothetical protein